MIVVGYYNNNNINENNNSTPAVEIKICCGHGAAIPKLHGDSLALCVVYMQVDGKNNILRFSAGGLIIAK